MALQQKHKEPDSGLSIETYWNIHIPKELVPWLIGVSVTLLTGSGILFSSDFSGPGQVAPAPTEAKE
jgi:hypothetical protein